MSIEELEATVRAMRAQLEEFARRMSKTQQDVTASIELEDQLVVLERRLARETGGEAAMPLELGLRWRKFDADPELISDDRRLTLVCGVSEPASNRAAIIEVANCVALMRTRISDYDGFRHPLHRHGLDRFGAYEIENSAWLRQVARLLNLDPGADGLRHLFLFFPNAFVELIAPTYSVRFAPDIEAARRAVARP